MTKNNKFTPSPAVGDDPHSQGLEAMREEALVRLRASEPKRIKVDVVHAISPGNKVDKTICLDHRGRVDPVVRVTEDDDTPQTVVFQNTPERIVGVLRAYYNFAPEALKRTEDFAQAVREWGKS